jgi:hypothetical protein
VSGDGTKRRGRRQKSTKVDTPKRGGPEAQAECIRLLSEGWQVSTVARQMGVSRDTIIEWRDCPEGQRQLAAARKARELEFADAVKDSRRLLRENAIRAIQVLVDKLDADTPFEALAAARDILDRAGVLRTERIELPTEKGVDLSKLSDAEFLELRRLRAKARGGGTPGGGVPAP